MHAFIFWGALLIGVRELTLMGEGFISGFQEYLPVLGSDSWLGYAYISVYNFCEVLVLAQSVSGRIISPISVFSSAVEPVRNSVASSFRKWCSSD